MSHNKAKLLYIAISKKKEKKAYQKRCPNDDYDLRNKIVEYLSERSLKWVCHGQNRKKSMPESCLI